MSRELRQLKRKIKKRNRFILKLILCLVILCLLCLKGFIDLENKIENQVQYQDKTSISDLKEMKNQINAQINKVKEFKSMCENIKNNVKILNRIVEAEATGGTIQQKENVCEVVLNRVYSDKFPNTIKEVVFQRNQFQPTFDGRYDKVKIQKSTMIAVQNCLSNYQYNKNHSPLFFMAERHAEKDNVNWFKNNLEFCYNDGIHSFYK